MAVSVMLVLIDTLHGRMRGQTWAWITLVMLAYNPIPWLFESNATSYGYTLYRALPIVTSAAFLLLFTLSALRHRLHPYILAWLVVVLLTRFPTLWGLTPGDPVVPGWIWQTVLVSIAFFMSFRPLFAIVHESQSQIFSNESANTPI
jgi:hypothetical protein